VRPPPGDLKRPGRIADSGLRNVPLHSFELSRQPDPGAVPGAHRPVAGARTAGQAGPQVPDADGDDQDAHQASQESRSHQRGRPGS
jgi:hypothetical protein